MYNFFLLPLFMHSHCCTWWAHVMRSYRKLLPAASATSATSHWPMRRQNSSELEHLDIVHNTHDPYMYMYIYVYNIYLHGIVTCIYYNHACAVYAYMQYKELATVEL